MDKPSLSVIFVLFGLISVQCAAARRQSHSRGGATSRPNIVFILGDDIGQHNLGYRNNITKTPNLDSLAASGLQMDNFYVEKWCLPSRGAIMTSRYSVHTGLSPTHPYPWSASNAWGMALDKQYTFLPAMLKKAGYSTHMLGKWNLGIYSEEFTPTSRGFDSYFGYLSPDEDYYTHFKWPAFHGEGIPNNFQGTDLYNNTEPAYNYTSPNNSAYNGTYSTYMYSAEMKKILAAASLDKDKPFFLYLAAQSTHSPYEAPQKYHDLYPDLPDDGYQRLMHSMVSAFDDLVGDVIDSLKEHDLWNNTLLLFTSDNGAPEGKFNSSAPAGRNNCGGSAFPYRGGKFTQWEGGTHQNAFFNGGTPVLPETCRGKHASGLMHLVDLFPTFAAVAGVTNLTKYNDEGRHFFDGVDQWEYISTCGKADSPRSNVLNWYGDDQNGAYRSGDWKIVVGATSHFCWMGNYTDPRDDGQCSTKGMKEPCADKPCLFNLADDIREMNNVAGDHPDIVDKLMTEFKAFGQKACGKAHGEANPCLSFANSTEETEWVAQYLKYGYVSPLGHVPPV